MPLNAVPGWCLWLLPLAVASGCGLWLLPLAVASDCCLYNVVSVCCLWQALQVIRMYSADSHECALFIDAMLDHHALILNETDDGYEFSEEVLVKGAVAGGRVTEDQFKR